MRNYRIFFLTILLSLAAVLSVQAQATTVRSEASLMDGPGSAGVVLDILSPGMDVEILTVEANWARIRIPATSEVGWVESNSLVRNAGMEGMMQRDGMTSTELSRVRGRVQMMSNGMDGIEQRVDSLLQMLGGNATPDTVMVAQMEPEGSTMTPGSFMPGAYAGFPVDGGPYRWNNQFVMGTYLRGGQSYYGLTLSCALDSRGRNVIVARGQYGLGELRGNDDDFVDWTLGMDFNLFPETYVVYPYFGAHFGMRQPVRGNRQRQGLPDCRAHCGNPRRPGPGVHPGGGTQGTVPLRERRPP